MCCCAVRGGDEICPLRARCCGTDADEQLITAGPCIEASRAGKICDEHDDLHRVSGMKILKLQYR